jgi:hypothetical protein
LNGFSSWSIFPFVETIEDTVKHILEEEHV